MQPKQQLTVVNGDGPDVKVNGVLGGKPTSAPTTTASAPIAAPASSRSFWKKVLLGPGELEEDELNKMFAMQKSQEQQSAESPVYAELVTKLEKDVSNGVNGVNGFVNGTDHKEVTKNGVNGHLTNGVSHVNGAASSSHEEQQSADGKPQRGFWERFLYGNGGIDDDLFDVLDEEVKIAVVQTPLEDALEEGTKMAESQRAAVNGKTAPIVLINGTDEKVPAPTPASQQLNPSSKVLSDALLTRSPSPITPPEPRVLPSVAELDKVLRAMKLGIPATAAATATATAVNVATIGKSVSEKKSRTEVAPSLVVTPATPVKSKILSNDQQPMLQPPLNQTNKKDVKTDGTDEKSKAKNTKTTDDKEKTAPTTATTTTATNTNTTTPKSASAITLPSFRSVAQVVKELPGVSMVSRLPGASLVARLPGVSHALNTIFNDQQPKPQPNNAKITPRDVVLATSAHPTSSPVKMLIDSEEAPAPPGSVVYHRRMKALRMAASSALNPSNDQMKITDSYMSSGSLTAAITPSSETIKWLATWAATQTVNTAANALGVVNSMGDLVAGATGKVTGSPSSLYHVRDAAISTAGGMLVSLLNTGASIVNYSMPTVSASLVMGGSGDGTKKDAGNVGTVAKTRAAPITTARIDAFRLFWVLPSGKLLNPPSFSFGCSTPIAAAAAMAMNSTLASISNSNGSGLASVNKAAVLAASDALIDASYSYTSDAMYAVGAAEVVVEKFRVGVLDG
ncbi:hypothetical protein HDU76_002874, partial [Blyttiomyces sp. JEL0837]